jgi:hypothetical protein
LKFEASLLPKTRKTCQHFFFLFFTFSGVAARPEGGAPHAANVRCVHRGSQSSPSISHSECGRVPRSSKQRHLPEVDYHRWDRGRRPRLQARTDRYRLSVTDIALPRRCWPGMRSRARPWQWSRSWRSCWSGGSCRCWSRCCGGIRCGCRCRCRRWRRLRC